MHPDCITGLLSHCACITHLCFAFPSWLLSTYCLLEHILRAVHPPYVPGAKWPLTAPCLACRDNESRDRVTPVLPAPAGCDGSAPLPRVRHPEIARSSHCAYSFLSSVVNTRCLHSCCRRRISGFRINSEVALRFVRR